MPSLNTQISALVCLCSLFYISYSSKLHSLTERPLLSSFLVLLNSSVICFLASLGSKWFPGSDDRFAATQRQEQAGPLLNEAQDDSLPKVSTRYMPNRPRRWFVPVAVGSVVARLQIYNGVNSIQQCASPGVQSFICLFLLAYDIYANRRNFALPEIEDEDDPWRSVFDDIHDWFTGHRVTLVFAIVSAVAFCLGTFLSVTQITRSTYFCYYAVDSWRGVPFLQFIGLVLDATIIILFWRILTWARTTKLRLRMLASLLCYSALSVAMMWLCKLMFSGFARSYVSVDLLYAFHVIVDSFVFVTLLISATFWICDASLVHPAAITTFLFGIFSASSAAFGRGDWLNNSRSANSWFLWLICLGTIEFTYAHDVRSILLVKRMLFSFILVALLLAASITAIKRGRPGFNNRHPIDDLIYKAHVDHDHWLKGVTTSTTLRAAVVAYQDYHDGKAPPPNFAEWYSYAEGSSIIDKFLQIERDLDPFWRVSPKTLRDRVDEATNHPGMATIMVRHGDVSASSVDDEGQQKDLAELANMIRKFSKHLPDMIIPTNLHSAPRVLPPWEAIHFQEHEDLSSIADLIIRRSSSDVNQTTALLDMRDGSGEPEKKSTAALESVWRTTTAEEFQHMIFKACPRESNVRKNRHSDVQEFCRACAKSHSTGQLLTSFDKSLDICAQPDLRYLHGFAMTNPQYPPIQKLLPIFGPSKMDGFSDIIIPLPQSRLKRPNNSWQFGRRLETLFWNGTTGQHAISNDALHGDHKFRLLHLINKPNTFDEVTMILNRPGFKDKFIFEKMTASDANSILSFNVGIEDYSSCSGNNCDLVKETYGTQQGVKDSLEYRYILLLDEDSGPPKDVLRTLKSGSVPFMSTMFRTWYTERLMPWLHFVPVDIRYQGLHTTLAYFTGTKDQFDISSQYTRMENRQKDAEWIANQGQRWAEEALREKDMEIYLFRLLLEWGRLIDDKRDEIGYWKQENGEFHNSEWTRQHTAS